MNCEEDRPGAAWRLITCALLRAELPTDNSRSYRGWAFPNSPCETASLLSTTHNGGIRHERGSLKVLFARGAKRGLHAASTRACLHAQRGVFTNTSWSNPARFLSVFSCPLSMRSARSYASSASRVRPSDWKSRPLSHAMFASSGEQTCRPTTSGTAPGYGSPAHPVKD